MARTSATRKTRVTGRKVTAKASAKRKTTPRASAKKSTAAKAGAKKRVTTKATAKKRTTTKAKARKRVTTKATAKKRTTTKAKAKKRVTTKATAKKRTTTKATAKKSVAPRRSPQSSKSDFDFNKWLLPTLELEQYEPTVEQDTGVADSIQGSTRYAWIGSGQCGGRLVKSFYDLGYKKVMALNTTHHDLDLLDIAKNQKFLMDIGEKGAGKDMSRGQKAVQDNQQEILHLAKQTFGTQVDHIMVSFGAGGGTGSGSAVGLIEIAKRYARSIGLKNPDSHVGAVMTLPTLGEASSPQVAENAYRVASELTQLASAGEISC